MVSFHFGGCQQKNLVNAYVEVGMDFPPYLRHVGKNVLLGHDREDRDGFAAFRGIGVTLLGNEARD